MNRAISLLAEAGSKGRAAQQALREVGRHPKDGKPIALHKGRYGLYVKHGRQNASLPKAQDPERSASSRRSSCWTGAPARPRARAPSKAKPKKAAANGAGKAARKPTASKAKAPSPRRRPRRARPDASPPSRTPGTRLLPRAPLMPVRKLRRRSPGHAPGQAAGALPDRDELLAHIEGSGSADKRDLIRTLGVKGRERTALKRMLRDLEAEGALPDLPAAPRRRADGGLPPVARARGERHRRTTASCSRARIGQQGDAPPIVVLSERGRAPAVGDRILARLSPAAARAGRRA